MDYKKTIQKSLVRAFNQMKSLTIDVTLGLKTSLAFDFETGDTAETTVSKVAKAIPISKIKTSPTTNTIRQQLMLDTTSCGSLSLYDTITIGGVVWKLGSGNNDDGYITIIDIYREA
jgi:hypothetical protein